MDLKGTKILVTGSSSGIGQAIAVAAAQQGAQVVVHYRNNKNGAEETLNQVQKYSNGFIIRADLTDLSQIETMFTTIANEVESLDAVINNAGEAHSSDFFNNAMWRSQFDNIFFSAVQVSQYFLKQNTAAAIRKIVNITSYYGLLHGGSTEHFAYSAAKAALASTTVMLAKLDPKVLVNAVAPGYTWTPAWEGISDREKQMCEDRNSIGRYITPDEVAMAVVMLLQNDAMTGQVISVDGGLGLQRLERH